MAGDYLIKPHKILNVTLTTSDPLTAEVLISAKRVKRLNAVIGMMIEAYLATPEGQVWAAQQLRMPLPELLQQLEKSPHAKVSAPIKKAVTSASSIHSEPRVGDTGGKSSINLDALCT